MRIREQSFKLQANANDLQRPVDNRRDVNSSAVRRRLGRVRGPVNEGGKVKWMGGGSVLW